MMVMMFSGELQRSTSTDSLCILALHLTGQVRFLADRTKGRAYTTVLCPSVCLSAVTRSTQCQHVMDRRMELPYQYRMLRFSIEWEGVI